MTLTYAQRKETWITSWHARILGTEPAPDPLAALQSELSAARDQLTDAHALIQTQQGRIDYLEGALYRIQQRAGSFASLRPVALPAASLSANGLPVAQVTASGVDGGARASMFTE